jgi:hypothetical protein
MLENYPRLAIFIGVIIVIFECIYATAAGTWLILQFGFPITSGFLIFVIGFISLGLLLKYTIEVITLFVGIIAIMSS